MLRRIIERLPRYARGILLEKNCRVKPHHFAITHLWDTLYRSFRIHFQCRESEDNDIYEG